MTATAGSASLPGPVLIANEGETIVVNLHNMLSEATSLNFPQMNTVPDTVGAAGGSTKSYTLNLSKPGTYLYEAGLTADGTHQAAMGMVGALVVRPLVPTQAYDNPNTAFTGEAVLVLSEIDPALNTNANPSAFDFNTFSPKYWLINGQAFPNIPSIGANAGDNVLLRFVNAGLKEHSMLVDHVHQTELAVDGDPFTNPITLSADTLGAGQTLDTLVSVPAGAFNGQMWPVYDASNHLDNNGGLSSDGTISYGGMLTFITAASSTVFPVPGPVVSNPAVSPNPTNGTIPVTVSANFTAGTGANVTGAEYFIDTIGPNGSGTLMAGTFGGSTASATATYTPAIPSGYHTFYFNGVDSNGTWGGFGSVVLDLDETGPTTRAVTLNPNPTNGTTSVLIQSTGDDTATGNSFVTAAELFVDPVGTPANGSGTPMTMVTTGPTVHETYTLPAASVAALSEGPHTIAIHSEDALGNWGSLTDVTLNVDKTGPTTSAESIAPSPTNGTWGIQIGSLVAYNEVVYATFTDPLSNGAQSNLQGAELFIDAPGPNGTGSTFFSNAGTWAKPSVSGYSALALPGIAALTQGTHTIYVHAEDAAGNWGPFISATFIVDKTGPGITAASASPNPTNGATSVTVTFSGADPANNGTPANAPASNIIAAEWFDGRDPGQGLATQIPGPYGSTSVTNKTFTINISTFAKGQHAIKVRLEDAAHNWGPVGVISLIVQPADGIFSDGFELGNSAAWTTITGTPVIVNGAAMGGTYSVYGMQATVSGVTPTYLTYSGDPASETSYRARFYFNPNSTTTGASTNAVTIFAGLSSTNVVAFQVQYRLTGTTAQVRAVVTSTGSATNTTSWYNITNNAGTAIEIYYRSGTSAAFSLYTAGTLRQTLIGLNTSANTIKSVRLGPSAGLAAGMSGTMYFDGFVSTRTTQINP